MYGKEQLIIDVCNRIKNIRSDSDIWSCSPINKTICCEETHKFSTQFIFYSNLVEGLNFRLSYEIFPQIHKKDIREIFSYDDRGAAKKYHCFPIGDWWIKSDKYYNLYMVSTASFISDLYDSL